MEVFKHEGYKVPVKTWCDPKWANDSFREQIANCASLPFAFHHFALMPDGHAGYGMPIGGVLATKGVILPNAVGVDIGCGMASYNTGWKAKNLTTGDLKKIMSLVRKDIPVGMNRRKVGCSDDDMPNADKLGLEEHLTVVYQNYEAAKASMGTLGGGNHFIEFQKADGEIYVMVHSGSRNLGKQICDFYNVTARDLNEKYFSTVTKSTKLNFLPVDTIEGKRYIDEMKYAVEFARLNRQDMMLRVLRAMNSVLSGIAIDKRNIVDVAHNYARLENHFGSNVWVHRKGATSAKIHEIGIIPGSQGSKSYIVKGKGNKESFNSCSHGAGRAMGRAEAKRTLDIEEERKRLKGIIHTIKSEDQLDESVGSYKDIEEVMNNQSDLIEIVTELTPLACIKG